MVRVVLEDVNFGVVFFVPKTKCVIMTKCRQCFAQQIAGYLPNIARIPARSLLLVYSRQTVHSGSHPD